MAEPRARLDVVARKAWIGGEPAHLPRLMFDLLIYLAARPGQAVTRDDLMREVWADSWGSTRKTIDMHISGLRRRLGDDAANPRYIHTLRGVGFRLEPGTVELAGQTAKPSELAAGVTAVRQLCEQALSGVGQGWVPAEVGKFAETVVAALDAALEVPGE